jgi:iron complex transport system substrate-binding protein
MLPDRIGRILPADRNAEVLVFVLAPGKLAGLERLGGPAANPPRGARRAVLAWRARSTPDSMAATARQVRADLIIDGGTATPERAAFADAVQQLAGIPYILVDSSIERTPAVLRTMGALLGTGEHAEELRVFAEHAIAGLRGRLLIRPASTRPRVYYALGADGLTTALPGSPAGRTIDEAGAINVAAALGRDTQVGVSREQLLGWDPEVIVAEKRSFYDALRRDRGWRRLSAVRHKKVYLEPSSPFGWIEGPAGTNRLIGLYWLSSLFYPDATQEDLRSTACDFYDKFYHIRLTNAQLEALVGPAGAPPPDAPRQFAEPLIGLGAAPASTLPGGPATGALGPPTPAPASNRTALCAVPGASTPLSGIMALPADAGATPPGRAGRNPAPR